MWETWQREDDEMVCAHLSASRILDFWPLPAEQRARALIRLTEKILDMITEVREYEAEHDQRL